MSRKLSKMERKLQRKAMLARVARGETPAEPTPGPQTPEDPWEEAKRILATRVDDDEPAPVQKRIQRVLETSAAELELAELEILEEVLQAAREGIALHKAEAHARKEAQQRGEPTTTRWQVAPGVFEKLAAKVLRIIEIKLRHRRGVRERQAA